jgi:hypothetical protein
MGISICTQVTKKGTRIRLYEGDFSRGIKSETSVREMSIEALGRIIDGWRVVDDDYGQAVGKLQAESMMSTAASLFPQ